MLISHEVPISLLEKSKLFNDYDYCLLHLTYENEEYRNFYKQSVREGRKVLLDNSLFELGDALTNDQLAKGVLDINPTWYVIPDCLNNKDATIDRFDKFLKDYPNLPGLKIGVVQGSNLNELIDCYKYMSENADKIAIPFDSKGFNSLDNNEDILERWCEGRIKFIDYLISNRIWNGNKPHHLLGCSYAKEFSAYTNVKSIESIDTSSPIVCGLNQITYGCEGNSVKPSIKLCELINHKCTERELKIINHNVSIFRSICNE